MSFMVCYWGLSLLHLLCDSLTTERERPTPINTNNNVGQAPPIYNPINNIEWKNTWRNSGVILQAFMNCLLF